MPDETYTIKEMLVEIRQDYTERLNKQDGIMHEIKKDVKDTSEKVGFQNGRVRLLEEWSNQAKIIIENNAQMIANYKTDKARLWTAVAILVFLGGAIITLSIMAIETKIEKGIANALAEFDKIEISE